MPAPSAAASPIVAKDPLRRLRRIAASAAHPPKPARIPERGSMLRPSSFGGASPLKCDLRKSPRAIHTLLGPHGAESERSHPQSGDGERAPAAACLLGGNRGIRREVVCLGTIDEEE